MMFGVSVVEETTNRKTGPISVTHVSQDSCPRDCVFYHAGCYAETGGQQRFVTEQLEVSGKHLSPDILAGVEAAGIMGLTGRRKLRAHIVGDCRTRLGAKVVGVALVAHEAKHKQAAWTYTHAWMAVHRSWWSGARVLASCHSKRDVEAAHEQGYAACVISTPRHPGPRVYQFDGLDIIPCPAQFHRQNGDRVLTCKTCRICQDTEMLSRTGRVVGFEPDRGSMQLVRRAGQARGAQWYTLPLEPHDVS